MRGLEPSRIRVGRRYRPGRLDGPYDALVVGSGIGGLTVAALLADLGRKVAVLEQHYTAGGYTHSYERRGYEWDVGVHYIGDMDPRTTPRRLFDFLTEGRLGWAPMDSHYDRFFIGPDAYDAVAGRQAFRENLVSRFPRQRDAIDRYLGLLGEMGRAMRVHASTRVLPAWLGALAVPLLRARLPRPFYRTTYEVLSELTDDQDLIAVLTGQWGDYGLPPRRSAFAVHAMVARHYLHGAYYPIGGSWRIADCILPRIRRNGGEVFTYARVRQLRLREGRVAGVEMADGSTIDCGTVISDAGVLNTFRHLLPAGAAREHGYEQALAEVEPSIGHVGMYLGLEATAAELGLPKTNYWVFPDNDSDAAVDRFLRNPEAPFPVVFISFPSAKDPDFERRHPGRSTVEIVVPAPYEWFTAWSGTTWGKRGEDYEQLKERLAQRMLTSLYARLPHLEGRVAYSEVSTPLSTEWFGAWSRGELYGLDHTPDRVRAGWLRPRTRIPGLWLTGQDTLSCGVVGAMAAGVAAFTAMVGPRRASARLERALAH